MLAAADPSGYALAAAAFAGGLLVAAAALLLLGPGSAMWRRRREAAEAARMIDLADAAIEGILVCDEDTVRAANHSFCELAGCPRDTVVGSRLADWFDSPSVLDQLRHEEAGFVEAELAGRGGSISVELLARAISIGGRSRRLIAVRDVRERKLAEERIRFLAHHDALTNLPNRVLFRERLEAELARAARSGEQVGVVCIDLDHFKDVNDLFGHSAGDKVLCVTAERLRDNIRGYDMVSRAGGDEFTFLIVAGDQPRSAVAAVERAIARVAEPIEVRGSTVRVGMTAGIAFFPQDGQDASTLLARADVALYRAKQEGRNRYRLFEPEMDQRHRERRRLALDLRRAIQEGGLSMAYQPAVNRQGEVLGFEALVRWRRPQGDVPPSVFIPLAEEDLSLMLPLARFALEAACREAAGWANKLKVSVNISLTQILHGDLAATVRDVLVLTGLEPERLELEIKEEILFRAPERAAVTLQQLHGLGVMIVLDDFGTGASSLTNLRNFPIHKVKLDGSFVAALGRDEPVSALVAALANLAHGLGVRIAAEGVESQEQFTALTSAAYAEFQGYFFAPADAIGRFRQHTGGAEVERLAG